MYSYHMNSKIKFLEIVLSDLISERDTNELELNRILNLDDTTVFDKKYEFKRVLSLISDNNNKINMLGEYMSSLTQTENNND